MGAKGSSLPLEAIAVAPSSSAAESPTHSNTNYFPNWENGNQKELPLGLSVQSVLLLAIGFGAAFALIFVLGCTCCILSRRSKGGHGNNKRGKRILDVFLAEEFLNGMGPRKKEMECLLMVGLWCAHPNHKSRPSIRQAIQVLNFEAPLPNLSANMHVPTFDDPPIASDQVIRSSGGAFLSNLCITVPR
ncbi:hypothetical protein COLO4_32429 [Corchorus olitorius]|uniref:Uncharacterized protein n=1 Tax=Corchorus olitorius TaxID=93759 RepID=A0A1R3GZG8_9ROSI|nr:hypothetical protein COLO4_32429 [Corchorus olitorius]